jgi:hypothetical protein
MPYRHKPKFVLLLTKEWRELLASRSFWLLLLMIGPLVGHAFVTAVGLYAEASGIGGGAGSFVTRADATRRHRFAHVRSVRLAATFLFPFVAIRVIARKSKAVELRSCCNCPEI